MKEVALEDLCTIIISEFVKQEQNESLDLIRRGDTYKVKFLNMSYIQRRKIIERLLDRILV